jgi:hypothetical protein
LASRKQVTEFVLRLGVPVIRQCLPDLQGCRVVMPIVRRLAVLDQRPPRWPSPEKRMREPIGG